MPIGKIHSLAVLPFLQLGNTEVSGVLPVLSISPVWIASLLSRVLFIKKEKIH